MLRKITHTSFAPAVRFGMTVGRLSIAFLALAGTVGACREREATLEEPVVEEPVAIRYQAGACFGTCPIFSVTVSRDEEATYMGDRFTAVTGQQIFRLPEGRFKKFADELAPLRPKHGSIPREQECNPGDMPSYTIAWIGADGSEQSLCIGEHGELKNAHLASNRMNRALRLLSVERFVGPSMPRAQ